MAQYLQMGLYPSSNMKQILSANIEIASVLILEKGDDGIPGGIVKCNYLLILLIISCKTTRFYYFQTLSWDYKERKYFLSRSDGNHFAHTAAVPRGLEENMIFKVNTTPKDFPLP